jgi:hypothetical protein
MINGNGFHYGRALASYRPLHELDAMVPWRYGLVASDVIAASQRMHVWIDPTKSQGGTLCLPMVFYKNAMNIPEMDWREMGELDLASVTTLEHANGGTDSVTISVFAWAEDVHLSIPTLAEPGAMLPQAGDEADQMSSGPISTPAAAVAKVAGSLANVPIIGNMARATQLAAGATSNIARMFGMSRPVDTGPITSYKPTYAGNMVNTNTLDTSTKLTYDVKQELSIDPITTGLGPADEMAISSIASRESYLTQFLWNTTDVPEALLWTCAVTPHMHDVVTFAGQTEYHTTPMSYVSLPFQHWRGNLKYRFQVVASAFHKGRLKIVYDPYGTNTSDSEYNVQYTHIIDLANERDFTIEVNWGQELSYLDVPFLDSGVPFSTTPILPFHEVANGEISVFVVNDLTTPSADLSGVAVLVSVAAGDNFEVVNPSLNNLNSNSVTFWPIADAPLKGAVEAPTIEGTKVNRVPLEPQADVADGDMTQDESAPISGGTHTELSPVKIDVKGNSQLVYYGDPVLSIRQLLKRYEHASTVPQFAIREVTYTTRTDFPAYRGYAVGPNAANGTAATGTPYMFCETTLMNWFTPLFLCRRGGIRHKYIYTTPASSFIEIDVPGSIMSVVRLSGSTGAGIFSVPDSINSASYSAQMFIASNRAADGHSGMVATPLRQNPTLEVELPFFSKYRFAPARRKNFRSDTDEFHKFHSLVFPATNTASLSSTAAVLDYVAAAEDFSLTFFQACPVFWKGATPTPTV